MWLANPDSLNDPFDCLLLFKLGNNRDQEIISEFNKVQPTSSRNFTSGLANEQIVSIFRWFSSQRTDFDHFLKREEPKLWARISELDEVRSKLGVASFGKRADNPLLWAYYADDHKGICIEYEIENVGKSLKMQDVEYVERVSDVKFDIELISWKKDKVSSLFFKSLEWNHEDEFRLINLNNNRYSHKVPISRVICGFRMSEDRYQQVRKYCQDLKVVKVTRFDNFTPKIPE